MGCKILWGEKSLTCYTEFTDSVLLLMFLGISTKFALMNGKISSMSSCLKASVKSDLLQFVSVLHWKQSFH